LIAQRFIQRHLLHRSGLSLMLSPFSYLNGLGQSLRRRHARQHRFPCKVVSIGNIVSGGSGKTPFTIYLAGLLRDMGYRFGVSHRGYLGSFEHYASLVSDREKLLHDVHACGDEAYLIASRLKGIPVVAGRKRAAAISVLLARFPDLDLVLMDDGFQHLSVARDRDIVCFDAATGIGNGLLLPAGYLREPMSALKQASLVTVIHKNGSGENPRWLEKATSYCGQVIHCRYQYEGFFDPSGDKIEIPASAGESCCAVSAIATPDSFATALGSLGIRIKRHFAFRDHYHYRDPNVISSLEAYCSRQGIRHILCTEKDIGKLAEIPSLAPRLRALRVSLSCDNQDGLLALLGLRK
jgi:tetraacyldisaccharide 4'-kinase